MSFLDSLNVAEKSREKKRRRDYLDSLTPTQRGDLFDAAVEKRRGELSAERAGISQGFDRAVDFGRTGVTSSIAAVALTPAMGLEGGLVAAGGIAATTMASSALLSAQSAWVDYQSRKLEATMEKPELGLSARELFKISPEPVRSAKAVGIERLSIEQMQEMVARKEQARLVGQSIAANKEPEQGLGFETRLKALKDKQLSAQQAARVSMGEPAVGAAQPPEARVQEARQKQEVAREAAQEPFEGIITAGRTPEKEKQAPAAKVEQPAPEVSLEESPDETKPGSRHFVGPNRSAKAVAQQAIASGMKLEDNNGKPVIETKDALIAPMALFMTDEKRRERVEAMVELATQKFAGQPLRLDGTEKFVSMALDAALARGLTVEVPEKYKELLAEKESALAVPGKQHPREIEPEGTITAGKVPEKARAVEAEKPERVTGTLVGYDKEADKDGRRKITVLRAGQEVSAWIPAAQTPAELQSLVNKPVRLEPPAKDAPARLVPQKDQRQQRDVSRELQR